MLEYQESMMILMRILKYVDHIETRREKVWGDILALAYVVKEMTSTAVVAGATLEEVFAWLCLEVSVDACFLLEFMLTVSELTFLWIVTFSSLHPVLAHLSLVLRLFGDAAVTRWGVPAAGGSFRHRCRSRSYNRKRLKLIIVVALLRSTASGVLRVQLVALGVSYTINTLATMLLVFRRIDNTGVLLTNVTAASVRGHRSSCSKVLV